jgi:uncharacterized protein
MDALPILLLTGFIVGILGTLIGAGGGFILVPVLLFAHPELKPEIITAISMAIVAANAISGSFAYAREKRIDYKAGSQFALFTLPGSVIGALITSYISQHIFNTLFGLLLILMGIYLSIKKEPVPISHLVAKPGPGWKQHTITDKSGQNYNYIYNQYIGMAISVAVGFISPILGIGGGIIHVPVIVHYLNFPVHVATATSHFILAIMSSVTVLVHLVTGNYSDPAIQHLVIFLAIGAITGAQLGAWLSHKIKGSFIIKALAISLTLVGIRILLKP